MSGFAVYSKFYTNIPGEIYQLLSPIHQHMISKILYPLNVCKSLFAPTYITGRVSVHEQRFYEIIVPRSFFLTYTCSYIYIYICTYTYTSTYTYRYTYRYTCTYICNISPDMTRSRLTARTERSSPPWCSWKSQTSPASTTARTGPPHRSSAIVV